MKTLNLFGMEVEAPESYQRRMSRYQMIKAGNRYRKSEDKRKRCKTCDHHQALSYHDKIYHKCEEIGQSQSSATDIRIGYVCDKWEAQK